MSLPDHEWRGQAACQKMDPNLFHPKAGWGYADNSKLIQRQVQAAKDVCARCQVVDACLSYAMAARVDEGIYGGLDPRERNALRRRRRSA